MSRMPTDPSGCRSSGCNCRPPASAEWDRRAFLKLLGLGVGAAALHPWDAMAGPFTREDFDKLVPADKRLRPEWVKSLTARGERMVYRGEELNRIGMPNGGLCAGQVYLGGDGRLWHWDIFNHHIGTGAEHYARPMAQSSPFAQAFAVRYTHRGQSQTRELDRAHWKDVSFTGEYPVGYVRYEDPESPVSVSLEAYSPFIPLNTEDSSLPATILEFTVTNRAETAVETHLSGWLENAIGLHAAESRDGVRRNRVSAGKDLLVLECSAEETPSGPASARPDIAFEDFEHETYRNWKVTGNAFGNGPIEISRIHGYQGDVAGKGRRVVTTHASAPGNSVEERDAATGILTSPEFTLERDYITFLVGGGAHKGKTCMNLLVEGKQVLTVTGQNNNRMRPVSWDVRRWAGKKARLEVIDQATGGWGNIGLDDIVFSDRPREPLGPLASEPDFGTMALSLLRARFTGARVERDGEYGVASLDVKGEPSSSFVEPGRPSQAGKVATRPFGQSLIGALTCRLKLAPGKSAKAVFIVSWHLPNLKMNRLPPGRHYATRFASAPAVAEYIARNYERLSAQTRLWHDTWYDSTLPYWFLDRTFLNTSILATSTCFRFGNGRFYGWEGVGCCEGTCGHVWQYAHAVARLFPDLERTTRENVDLRLAMQPDGAIHFRGEFNDIPAVDAQAGVILRALREHQMSAEDDFLRRNWPRIRKATEWLLAKDGDGDGIIEGNQHNTLDTDWYGPVAWLSGLYLASLSAAATMAREAGDLDFAARCSRVLAAGQKNVVERLFDGEYFLNKPDPKHADAINSGSGCELDQVFGQSWAFQVGLGRVLPKKETVSALRSLWRYNFTPDVGPYRAAYKAGRWYAMAGEAGLLMCSFPRRDWDYAQAKGKGPEWAAGYFNECMNGFEYQVAGHMIWEGMLTEGLAITRALHDRYHASRRNPWNEVECGDHYARSMASYGVFLAACGYEYHGPKGHLGFAPRLRAQAGATAVGPGRGQVDFRCAFTAAEGWGTYEERSLGPGVRERDEEKGSLRQHRLTLKWGKLRLRSLSLGLPQGLALTRAQVLLRGSKTSCQYGAEDQRLRLEFPKGIALAAGQSLEVYIG